MMTIGNHHFDTEHETYIMGILNVTPDSFSDGGRHNVLDAALRHAERMLAEGAAIIDVGGESTRPGYTPISDEEEIARIAPVIEALTARFDAPVSVDTYKSAVAKAAIDAGAAMVNDIWGFKHDEKMAPLVAATGTACCLMHNRHNRDYGVFLDDLKADLCESVEIALAAGVPHGNIVLDPGVGFAKSHAQNLQAIQEVGELHELGYPLLLGTSRKSVIAKTLDLPVEGRLEGTLATTVLAVMKQCAFVRVHDVAENHRVIKMTRAILQQAVKGSAHG